MAWFLSARTLAVAGAASLAMGAWADSPAQWQALMAPLKVSLEQAVKAAEQATPGKVIDVELDDGDKGSGAGPRYEAKVLNAEGQRAEVWVDAVSGQARVHERDTRTKSKDVQRAQDATLSITQAVQAATAHTAGKAVKAELDSHRGTTVYKVDVLQADHTVMEIKLDAKSGAVLRAQPD